MTYIGPQRIKDCAKHLKKALANAGCDVAHGRCIEAMTAGFGYRTWASLLDSAEPPSLENWDTIAALARLQGFEGVGELPDDLRGMIEAVLPSFREEMRHG